MAKASICKVIIFKRLDGSACDKRGSWRCTCNSLSYLHFSFIRFGDGGNWDLRGWPPLQLAVTPQSFGFTQRTIPKPTCNFQVHHNLFTDFFFNFFSFSCLTISTDHIVMTIVINHGLEPHPTWLESWQVGSYTSQKILLVDRRK